MKNIIFLISMFYFVNSSAETVGKGIKFIDNYFYNKSINKTIITDPPTGNSTQFFCAGAILSNIQVSGTNIKWYISSSGGNILPINTLLVNNTIYHATQTIGGVESNSRIAVLVIVDPTPVATQPDDYHLCDYNGAVGYETFNLSTTMAQIFGVNSIAFHIIRYFTNYTDAENGTNNINNVANYTNTTINTQTIYIRLENNASGCYDIVTLQLIVDPLTSGQCNYVTDADGNLYNTVVIGNQEWLSENLKTTKYCNGDTLPINNNNSTGTWGNLTVGAWNFVNSNSTIYQNEKFYNWYAASDSRNICPCNWHVPTDNEWTILENYLIANGFNYDGTTNGNKIAKAMASQNSFWSNGTQTLGAVGNNLLLNNSSGFNALPFGTTLYQYGYTAENYTFWWSSNEWITDNTYAIWRGLSYQNNNLCSGAPDIGMKGNGFSIRCLKNNPLSTENQTKSSFYIYPNPAKNIISINLSTVSEPSKYIIYETSGKTLIKGTIDNENSSVNISELQSGMYYLTIMNDNLSETKIFIKQ